MSSFEIEGKVALVTGGASGIGLEYSKALLRKGLKGVTLADVDENAGKNALKEIENAFGANKAIFVKTDVTNYSQFENAFKKTVETFKNVDILINNAGILNDSIWEKQIAINFNGTVNGLILGVENYIQKYKSGAEGLIINIASVAGIMSCPYIPIYSGTKAAVLAMGRSFGDPDGVYERTKVRVVVVCPGVTDTPLIRDMMDRNLGPPYRALLEKALPTLATQGSEDVAASLVEVVQRAQTGSVWVLEAKEVYEIETPARWELRKKDQ